MRNNGQPYFYKSDLDGGYVVAVEIGPRSEMLKKSRDLDKSKGNMKPNEPVPSPEQSKSQGPDTNLSEVAITIGAQMGDRNASNTVTPHFMALKKTIKQCCKKSYSDDVGEFAFVLRVDGDIWHWNMEGCDKLRRNRQGRYITIDMYVPRMRWDGVDSREIRKYLVMCMEDGLQKMLAKLQRDKVGVAGDALLRDFATVKDQYLSQHDTVASH